MKYNEIIEVKKSYQSVFDMTAEITDSWQNFVTNLSFEEYLKQIIDSLISPIEGSHKSIWVEGTFGTGKSHSSSVVKHLLSDPLPEIESFVRQIENTQLREKLTKYREQHKVFPVVLKGICNIKDAREMCIQVQIAVKKAFDEKGISLNIESDFEKAIKALKKPTYNSFFDELISKQFAVYGYTKDDVISHLEEHDLDVLNIIENKWKEDGFTQFEDSAQITEWLTSVASFIRANGIADDLMIFWDEFTPLLSITEKRAILSITQNIAELSRTSHVYLFVITHIDIEATEAFRDLNAEERNLLKDRFKTQRYNAQYDTVYQILSASLDRKNPTELDRLIDKRVKQDFEVTTCIQKLIKTSSHPESSKSKLEHLYPLHPYTSFAATFLARNVGSSERSIFDFLTDPSAGFKQFLLNDVDDKKFVTLDYIWDFFLQKLEESTTYSDIITCFRNNRILVEEASPDYLRILKGLLLLNALQSNVSLTSDTKEDQSIIAPYLENILLAFAGEISSTVVRDALAFFDDRGIVTKQPDDRFLINLNTVPSDEIIKVKTILLSTHKSVTDFADTFAQSFRLLARPIEEDGCLRRNVHVEFLSPTASETAITNQLTRFLDDNYGRRFILGVFLRVGVVDGVQHDPEPDEIKNLAQRLLSQKAFQGKPVAFVVVRGTEMKQKTYNGLINALAYMQVFRDKNLDAQYSNKGSEAANWFQSFVTDIQKEEDCVLLYGSMSFPVSFPKIAKTLKEKVIKQLFKDGLDDLEALPATIWPTKTAPVKGAINLIMAGDASKVGKKYQALLQDYYNVGLFGQDLTLQNKTAETSVTKLIKKVEEEMEKHKKDNSINLKELFSFLFEPPYGYGFNEASSAALALAFKPYINQIYTADSGEPLGELGMVMLVQDLMNACIAGKAITSKLTIRFSTEESRLLSGELSRIFGLEKGEADGLVSVRWDLREKFKRDNKAPIWILKYFPKVDLKRSELYEALYHFTYTTLAETPEEKVKRLLELITNNKIELMNALQELKSEDLMQKYISMELKKQFPEASPDQEAECYLFVCSRVSGDTVFWDEGHINTKIEAYVDSVKRANSIIGGIKPNTQTETDPIVSPVVIQPNQNGFNELRSALFRREINNDELKDLLLELGKEHPELIPDLISKLNKDGR